MLEITDHFGSQQLYYSMSLIANYPFSIIDHMHCKPRSITPETEKKQCLVRCPTQATLHPSMNLRQSNVPGSYRKKTIFSMRKKECRSPHIFKYKREGFNKDECLSIPKATPDEGRSKRGKKQREAVVKQKMPLPHNLKIFSPSPIQILCKNKSILNRCRSPRKDRRISKIEHKSPKRLEMDSIIEQINETSRFHDTYTGKSSGWKRSLKQFQTICFSNGFLTPSNSQQMEAQSMKNHNPLLMLALLILLVVLIFFDIILK